MAIGGSVYPSVAGFPFALDFHLSGGQTNALSFQALGLRESRRRLYPASGKSGQSLLDSGFTLTFYTGTPASY